MSFLEFSFMSGVVLCLSSCQNANVTGAVRHFVTDLVSKMNWMDAVTKEKAKKKVGPPVMPAEFEG